VVAAAAAVRAVSRLGRIGDSMRAPAVRGLVHLSYRLHEMSLPREERGWRPYVGEPVHQLDVHATAVDAGLERVFRDSLYVRPAPPRIVAARSGGDAAAPGLDWIVDTRVPLARAQALRPVAEAMARRLDRIEARQIAGRGFGAYLLIGATLTADDRLRGALVRDAPKPHGTRRQIEGDLDPAQPVFISL
jgi:hypothetical protein